MYNINFLKQKRVELKKKRQKAVKVVSIGFLTLVVSIGLTVGVFLFNLTNIVRLKAKESKIKKLEQEIASQKDKEIKYRTIAEKLKIINNLFKDKVDKQDIIKNTIESIKDISFVKDITFENKTIEFTILTKDVFTFAQLINIVNTDIKNKYPKIKMIKILRNKDLTYQLVLRVIPS